MKQMIFLFIGLLPYIISCASVPVQPNTENISYPPINTTASKSIGDILLSQGTRITHEGIELSTDANNGKIPKGIYVADKVFYDTWTALRPLSNSVNLNRYGGAVTFLAIEQNTGELYACGLGGYGNVLPYNKIPSSSYKKTVADIEDANAFQQSLIYTGKEKNIIKLTYREFSGGIARPAFTIDATYDIGESDTIAFKSARLKIIEATNTSITYIVISNFN